MTAYTINIEFTFPTDRNGNVNIHGTPTIDNLRTQLDEVTDSYDSIKWTTSASNSTDKDGLNIQGITFYTDSNKSITTTPSCLNTGTRNTGDGSFTMTFKNMDFPDTTFYYDVIWEDSDITTPQRWDPTLEIKPRVVSGGHQAGAGA